MRRVSDGSGGDDETCMCISIDHSSTRYPTPYREELGYEPKEWHVRPLRRAMQRRGLRHQLVPTVRVCKSRESIDRGAPLFLTLLSSSHSTGPQDVAQEGPPAAEAPGQGRPQRAQPRGQPDARGLVSGAFVSHGRRFSKKKWSKPDVSVFVSISEES